MNGTQPDMCYLLKTQSQPSHSFSLSLSVLFFPCTFIIPLAFPRCRALFRSIFIYPYVSLYSGHKFDEANFPPGLLTKYSNSNVYIFDVCKTMPIELFFSIAVDRLVQFYRQKHKLTCMQFIDHDNKTKIKRANGTFS